MSFEPDPLQQLVLWRLAVSDDGGEFLKNLETTSLTPARRKPLLREGLIAKTQRKAPKTGRQAMYFELQDKGWAWCQHHLGEEIKSTSNLSRAILQRLLGLLKLYFEGDEHATSFGEFVLHASTQGAAMQQSGNGQTTAAVDMAAAIRRACVDLADGEENVRVRLADLRSRLSEYSRGDLDKQLLEMERAGALSLYSLDNPREMKAADRDAALQTSTGHQRHIIYFGGATA